MLLVHVLLLTLLAVTKATEDEEFSCKHYGSVNEKFKDCLSALDVSDFQEMMITMLSDEIITGDEFLAQLTTSCSDEERGIRIAYCVQRIVNECPELQQIVSDTVENKISFFCENSSSQASSTLADVLENGYEFRLYCTRGNNPVMQILTSCAHEVYSGVDETAMQDFSVNDTLSIFQQIGHTLFQCTLERARNEVRGKLACGSTWQDTLFTYWLIISGQGILTPTLGESDMAELKSIYDMSGIVL